MRIRVWVGHSCPTPWMVILLSTARKRTFSCKHRATDNPGQNQVQRRRTGVSGPHMHYLTHICSPFDILGYRADDLVVPDPGPEYCSGVSGRISGLPSSAQPYEGIVFQRNPRQGVIQAFSLRPAHLLQSLRGRNPIWQSQLVLSSTGVVALSTGRNRWRLW